jgi:hypothetical protein
MPDYRSIPADPRNWRPQRVDTSRGVASVDNPVAEPIWSGTRVLVFFREADNKDEWGTVEAIDEEGNDAFDGARRAFDQVRRSVIATEAVFDGIVTDQTIDTGVSMEFDQRHPELGKDLAFVAVDLLRVDDVTLFDVPLLERKRLLEGVLLQSPLIRLTPYVTPPIHAWLRTWRTAGFKGAIVKGANSKYVPGSRTFEWTVVEKNW